MKIVELGAIIEIRVPNGKITRFKGSEKKISRYLRNSIMEFMNKGLKKIGIFDVYYTNGMDAAYNEDTICEINDFNYSCNNEVAQNKKKKTYRFFGGTIMTIVDGEVHDDDKFIGTHDEKPTIIEFNGNEFSVVTSMYAEHKNRN